MIATVGARGVADLACMHISITCDGRALSAIPNVLDAPLAGWHVHCFATAPARRTHHNHNIRAQRISNKGHTLTPAHTHTSKP